MYGMVVWTCLVVLHQFHGVLCDETKEVNWEFKTNVTKSGPECDNQNTKHNNGKTLSSKTIEPKENIVSESTDKIKVSTNERNEPRDVNNILIDIATIAHNKNNTKGIEKIRQLVDEIAKQNEIKHNVEANGIKPLKDEPSVTNAKTVLRYIEPINDIETKETMNIVSLKKPTKHSENDQLVTKNTKIVLKHIEPTNYIETKETVDIVSLKKPTNHTKGEQLITENAKTVSPINDIETNETVDIVSPKKHEQLLTKNTKVVVKYVEPRNKTTKKESVFHIFVNKPITGDHEDTRTTEIKAPKPLFINTRRQAGDISDHDGDRAITTSKDENQIEIKEHMYKEDLLRRPNTQENAYNWYNGQNYNHNYGNRNVYTGYEDYIDNYYSSGYNPLGNYNGNKEYYTISYPSNQGTNEENQDCTRYTKTTLDRDTVISVKPNELVKSLNEDRKEITNMQSPDFQWKYYSDMQNI